MQVKDFMIKNPVVLKESNTVRELLETMVEHKIGGVPVVDENNVLVGIATDGDALRFLNPKRNETMYAYAYMYYAYGFVKETLDETIITYTKLSIANVMKTKVQVVKETDDFEAVLTLLAKHHFKKIPVIDEDKKVVGIISRGDVIKQLSNKVVEKLKEQEEK